MWGGQPGPGRCWVQEGGVSGRSLSSRHMSADAQLRPWDGAEVGCGSPREIRGCLSRNEVRSPKAQWVADIPWGMEARRTRT